MKKILLLLQFLLLLTISKAQQWSELGTGSNALNPNGTINSIVTDAAGNIYAAGEFTDANKKYYVAKWNGTSWSELGTGKNALNVINNINAIAVDAAGNVYAAGDFFHIDSTNTGFVTGYDYYVAQWNGTSWNELGNNIEATTLNANSQINCIAVDGSGNVYAAGEFTNSSGYYYVAQWNGSSWSEMGALSYALNANSYITSITLDKNENVYVSGWFTDNNSQTYVARWDGTQWGELGTGIYALNPVGGYVNSLDTDAAGNIYAGGAFTNGNGNYFVSKWNGTYWSELSNANSLNANNQINAITIDPSGNIYAAGEFTDAGNYYYVAKWNGNSWSELSTATSSLNANSYINALASDTYGNIYATGLFTDANKKFYVAKWTVDTSMTAIHNPVNKTNISIYPNPSTGVLYFSEFKENVQLTIYNILGEVIIEREVTVRTNTLDLSTLHSGMYTLAFNGQNTVYAPVRLVKE